MEKEKTMEELLKEKLFYKKVNAFTKDDESYKEAVKSYAENYKVYLDKSKTEREAVTVSIEMLKEAGFVEYNLGDEIKAGGKYYFNNRNKSLYAFSVGSENIENGVRICAAHIDSPRLDLKQHPLYEQEGFAYLKTHYYGGVRKYQWITIPLALHGVVTKINGETVNIVIGEDENDPILVISDLLIHLSADQMKKPLAEGIVGEQLNVILGTEPLEGEGSDLVKLHVMKLLNEKYGIVESDFHSAELTIVPAGKCREVGFDRSLLGAYGHDDRVCVYAELEPMLDMGIPTHTAVCIFADKEEIGSVGISGMQSQVFDTFMQDLCDATGANLNRCFENSFCLSADVSNAFDPNFAETCDKRNNSQLNYGVAICKYTGSRGKGGASDASAEAMFHVRKTLDDAGVRWQVATLGKVDQGGGGTVAAYMANRNIVTVDAGVPVLCMHAPMEIVSKYDCYMTMLACKAIYLA